MCAGKPARKVCWQRNRFQIIVKGPHCVIVKWIQKEKAACKIHWFSSAKAVTAIHDYLPQTSVRSKVDMEWLPTKSQHLCLSYTLYKKSFTIDFCISTAFRALDRGARTQTHKLFCLTSTWVCPWDKMGFQGKTGRKPGYVPGTNCACRWDKPGVIPARTGPKYVCLCAFFLLDWQV